MFDSVKFGIGVVTSEAFESLDSPLVKYCYAWKYNDEPTTEKEEKEVSDDLMKAINKEVSLEEFVPRYLNQAIIFTRDDMGSDRAMMIVFLYIVIAIMAFAFWHYNQQHHCKRGKCHRNSSCQRLHQK